MCDVPSDPETSRADASACEMSDSTWLCDIWITQHDHKMMNITDQQQRSRG